MTRTNGTKQRWPNTGRVTPVDNQRHSSTNTPEPVLDGAEEADEEGYRAVGLNPVKRCDHICHLDYEHVERGEGHQYGYEHPSPRDGERIGVQLLVLSSAARDLVDAASVGHTAEEWPSVLAPLINRLEQILDGA
jgi:hypothetical protein